jgi:hypothetical protein
MLSGNCFREIADQWASLGALYRDKEFLQQAERVVEASARRALVLYPSERSDALCGIAAREVRKR